MITFATDRVLMSHCLGWEKKDKKDITIWFKGYLHNSSISNIYEQAFNCLNDNDNDVDIVKLSNWVNELRGHFSFIIRSPSWIFATVDKVNTIPLFYFENNNNFFVGNRPSLIKDKERLNQKIINNQSYLEISMSGYTTGRDTIYPSLFQLTAGECLLFHNNVLSRNFYYTYSPWKVNNRSEDKLIRDFNNVLHSTMTELIRSTKGRKIVIPLSAGNDSRLVASGLKHFGVKDVLCISYGRKNSFESIMAKEIAHKLGYKWKHVLISDKNKRKFFHSKKFQKYKNNYDSYSSIPAVQDIAEICLLKENNIIPDDSIIVNGNSGDFISGGHISSSLMNDLKPEVAWELFMQKHYSLWSKLYTSTNKKNIIKQLLEVAKSRDIPLSGHNHGFFETFEYLGRQSMYVVNQQQAYDFNGYEWRLPLWSDSFINFWEGVPMKYKVEQNLYNKVLQENNWGGVWRGMPINKKNIRPKWIAPLRLISKIFLSPFGKPIWHKFEKNVFQYWMDVTRNSVIVPYHKVLLDSNGQKNTFSWVSKMYLEEKQNINLE
jgi:asparagine synthase (glutamine-hydrolysing)